LADLACEVVAVEARQPDIEEPDLRTLLDDHGEAFVPVPRRMNLVAFELQQRLQDLARIVLVLNDHDRKAAILARLFARFDRSAHVEGQAHGELRPASEAVAARGNRPAMRHDDALRDRETEAQSALGAREALSRLREHPEDALDFIRLDPAPLVGHDDVRECPIGSAGDAHAAALGREAQRVVKKVGHDLGEAACVAEHR
jgi:hypothetical protein